MANRALPSFMKKRGLQQHSLVETRLESKSKTVHHEKYLVEHLY
jgi:hypothetical protein